jgi:aerobic-type carbon monoxide dehydrogenase small subunit (CoxS/CutS family)
MADRRTIGLTLHYLGESHQVQTYAGEHYSLMTLISHHLAIPGFGLCCGMGSCGTCIVQLADTPLAVKRAVLACGIQVNDGLANAHIFIADKAY